MGKFNGVLLASDFDNTLVDTTSAFVAGRETPVPSAEVMAALRYFVAEGGRFTVATGRALAGFSDVRGEIPMNAPAILCNGAALYDFASGTYLESSFLDRNAQILAQEVLERHPDIAAEAYQVDNTIYAVQANEYTRRHEHITRVKVMEAPSLLDVPAPLGKLMFEGDRAELEQIRRELESDPRAAAYEMIFSASILLEVTVKGVSKGSMVEKLARRLGIDMEHVYCAGDESNDLSMLAVAAQGFAPANCVEAVRSSGATIVSSVSENAMAEIIAILDKKYS